MHSGSESEDGMEPEEFSDPITLSLMVPVVCIIYTLIIIFNLTMIAFYGHAGGGDDGGRVWPQLFQGLHHHLVAAEPCGVSCVQELSDRGAAGTQLRSPLCHRTVRHALSAFDLLVRSSEPDQPCVCAVIKASVDTPSARATAYPRSTQPTTKTVRSTYSHTLHTLSGRTRSCANFGVFH